MVDPNSMARPSDVIARAVAKAAIGTDMWDRMHIRQRDAFRLQARAALTALSENITVEMVEAGAKQMFIDCENEGRPADKLMSIDSATVRYWFSQTEQSHGEDHECWRMCEDLRKQARSTFRAMLNQAMKEQG